VGKNSTAVDCAAAVTVVDTVPPTIFCPAARTVECSAGAGTTSGFAATGWDLCSASIVPSDKSGTYPFAPPAKTTGVTFSITDAQGLGSSCRSSVTVADTLPPNLLATPQPVWKSSDIEHQDTGNVQHSDLVTVKLSECVALAADACDGTLDADRSGKISRVERLSPDQESEGCDLGSMILSGSSVQLEPDNEGAYRIYFAVTDASGNSRASSCEVRFTDGDHGQRPPRPALTCSCCEGVGCGTCPPPTPEDHGRH
jgi:hypothetical protein